MLKSVAYNDMPNSSLLDQGPKQQGVKKTMTYILTWKRFQRSMKYPENMSFSVLEMRQ